jgi:hypothetical protein
VQVEQPRMQVEVLADNPLGVEREGLQHASAPRSPCPVVGRTAAPHLLSAAWRPVSIFIVVVFPQPFEPTKPRT